MVVDISRSRAVLTTNAFLKLLKSKVQYNCIVECLISLFFRDAKWHNLLVNFCCSWLYCFKERGTNLSCVRTCVIVAEERPRIGLASRAVSTSFGCRVNVALCVQVAKLA